METNWRKTLVYILIFLTLVAIGVALYLSTTLAPSTGGDTTTTPTVIPTPTTTPTIVEGSCAERGLSVIGVTCRKDDSTVCNTYTGSGTDITSTMVGEEICSDGNVGECAVLNACAPTLTEGLSCDDFYPGVNEAIQSLSSTTSEYGSFVGCDVNNQVNNCYCDFDGTDSSVNCFADERVDGFYQYCGLRSTSGGGVDATITPTVGTSVTPTTGDSLCPTAPACPNGDLLPEETDANGCTTYFCDIDSDGGISPTPTDSILPDTALTGSDEIDRIIIGTSLIVISLLIFLFNLHTRIGQNLYKFYTVDKDKEIKKSRDNFEEKLR